MKKNIGLLLFVVNLVMLGCSDDEPAVNTSIEHTITKTEEAGTLTKASKISIGFLNSESFVNNDTTWFKITPRGYYAVSLKPKKSGCFLIVNGKDNGYYAYVNNLDSVTLEITKHNFNGVPDQDTIVLQFATISKN
ncbi:MAG: hypothetical protein JKX74_01970 [Flavobacteriales bacterium]|nr:hypothetical protein [Flavobacteriales bacterium]